jgi:hypothetical protein
MEYEYNATNVVANRDQIKKILFKVIYSKPTSYIKYKLFFGNLFPSIMEHITIVNSITHNTLAIQLQLDLLLF